MNDKTFNKFMHSKTLPPISAQNPLQLFPSKKDVIKGTFVSNISKTKENFHESESKDSLESASGNSQWLHPDRISDSTFGITGNSSQDNINRAYRRIVSSSLFVQPIVDNTQLSSLDPIKKEEKTYVLVEQSKLNELIHLDQALQREKNIIGAQCANICNDYQLPARIPLPATRFAIHNLCEEQMKKVQKEIIKLQKDWSTFCVKNHYHKPHLFSKDSYIKSAPLGFKTMKLRLVKEAIETWSLRRERDTMMYEDDLSFLTCLYYDALQRQRDYERYYILANRYRPYTDEEFSKDNRPGKRYYQLVSRSALKIQMLWDRFHAMAKLKRYRAARMIQKHFRGHYIYRKLHPIIRLRLKIGKKTYYIFCFQLWKDYINICKRIKEAINFQLSSCIDVCFKAWKGYVINLKNQHQQKIGKFISHFKNSNLYTKFIRWKKFVDDLRSLKKRLKRLFACPHFDMWVNYVKWQKHIKKLNRGAMKMQSLARMFIIKRKFLNKKKSKTKLWHFSLLVRAKGNVSRLRESLIFKMFQEWLPGALHTKTSKLNEIERQRLQRKQLFIQDKERNGIQILKTHLMSYDGLLQLQHLVHDQESLNDSNLSASIQTAAEPSTVLMKESNLSNKSPTNELTSKKENPQLLTKEYSFMASEKSEGSMTSEDASKGDSPNKNKKSLFSFDFFNTNRKSILHQKYDKLSRKMKKELVSIIRITEGFNYDSKYPATFKCFNPHCHSTFTTEEQYHNHIKFSTAHKQEDLMLESLFSYLQDKLPSKSISLSNKEDDKSINSNSQGLVKELEKNLLQNKKFLQSKSRGNIKKIKNFFVSESNSTVDSIKPEFIALYNSSTPLQNLSPKPSDSITSFALLLRQPKGQELYKNFLIKYFGFSYYSNYLDAYLAIQDWKRSPLNTTNYYTKAINIYELFFDEQSVRYCPPIQTHYDIPLSQSAKGKTNGIFPEVLSLKKSYKQLKEIVQKFKTLDIKQFMDFYHPLSYDQDHHIFQKQPRGGFNFLQCFGLNSSDYIQFTTKYLLLPTFYNEIEYPFFLILYLLFKNNYEEFSSSLEFQQFTQFLQRENILRSIDLLQEFELYRYNMLLQWSKSYKQYDNAITTQALVVVEQILQGELDRIYLLAEKQEVQRKVIEIRHEEQNIYEMQRLVMNDALFWTEEDIVEVVFEFYVRSFVNAMWENKDYRKGMMQYAGYMKRNFHPLLAKKGAFDTLNSAANKEWFEKTFRSIADQDQSETAKALANVAYAVSRPTTSNNDKKRISWGDDSDEDASDEDSNRNRAAVIIQRRVRGWQHRNQVRKLFAKTFKKYFDDEHQVHYYYNTLTRASSWTQPKLFKYLYPKAKKW